MGDTHSPWNAPDMVAGFVQSPPNAVLMQFAADEFRRCGGGLVLDIGCGAGRNAVPLASMGWHVLGIDLSGPMLQGGATRAQDEGFEPGQGITAVDREAAHGVVEACGRRGRGSCRGTT